MDSDTIMNFTKKKLFAFALLLLATGFVLDALLADKFIAWISTRDFIQRYHLLSPKAPLVIHTTEQIKVESGNDLFGAGESSKKFTSSVFVINNQTPELVGTAANITEDGLFLSVSTAFAQAGKQYFVMTNSGAILPIESLITDPASRVVLFKAKTQNLPIARFGQANKLESGNQLVSVSSTLQPQSVSLAPVSVDKSSKYVMGKIFTASTLSEVVNLERVNKNIPGSILVNKDSELVAVWDGSMYVSGEQLNLIIQRFLSNGKSIPRTLLGLKYRYVSPIESKEFSKPLGAEILSLEELDNQKIQYPTAIAGLKIGDVIKEVNDQSVSYESPMESLLSNIDSGSVVRFKVSRLNQELTIVVTPIELSSLIVK